MCPRSGYENPFRVSRFIGSVSTNRSLNSKKCSKQFTRLVVVSNETVHGSFQEYTDFYNYKEL